MTDKILIDPNQKPVRTFSRSPVGINLNFLMDGNYYQNLQRPLSAALDEMGVTFLRYPGGEKADNTLWALPPYDKPNPALARYGEFELRECFSEFVEQDYRHFKPFVLDFDQFISLCRTINAEPIVVVPYDSMFIPPMPGCSIPSRDELLRNAIEWVQYANIVKGYKVKYWEIGNESYIIAHRCGAKAKDYAKDLLAFSKAMKKVDPDIYIIANGPNCVHENEKAVAVMDQNTGENWWDEVFRYGSEHIDRIAFHNYPCLGWGSYDYYANNNCSLTDAPVMLDRILTSHCTREEAQRIKLLLTETNSADWSEWIPGSQKPVWTFNATLGHAIVLADIIGSHLLHQSVECIAIWNTRWVLNNKKPIHEFWDALDENNQLLPSGTAIKLWNTYLLETMLPVKGCSGMSIYCSTSRDKERIHIFIINKTTEYKNIKIMIPGNEYHNIEHIIFSGNNDNDTSPYCKHLASYNNRTPITLYPVSLNILCYVKR